MDLSDVLRRIIAQHWRLLVAAIAVTVALAGLLHLNDTTTYTAKARVVLDTQDPETRAESEAIADTAKAIATSPALVRTAMCSSEIPEYSTGISQPANGTIRAFNATCRSYSAVRRSGDASGWAMGGWTATGRPCRRYYALRHRSRLRPDDGSDPRGPASESISEGPS